MSEGETPIGASIWLERPELEHLVALFGRSRNPTSAAIGKAAAEALDRARRLQPRPSSSSSID